MGEIHLPKVRGQCQGPTVRHKGAPTRGRECWERDKNRAVPGCRKEGKRRSRSEGGRGAEVGKPGNQAALFWGHLREAAEEGALSSLGKLF